MSDSDSDEPPFKRARSTIWKRKKRKEQESDSFDSSDTFVCQVSKLFTNNSTAILVLPCLVLLQITADAASTAVNPSEEVASDSDKVCNV